MLVGFRLVLRRRAEGRLLLTIPLWFRLLLAGIGALILASMIFAPPEGERGLFVSRNTLPLLISALALLGAAYHERWVFDKPGDCVTHQSGLAFVHGNRRLRMSDLEALVVEQFVKGRLDRPKPPDTAFARRSLLYTPLLTISLRTRDGALHRLETYGASQRVRVQATAQAIAAHCGIALEGEPAPSGGVG